MKGSVAGKKDDSNENLGGQEEGEKVDKSIGQKREKRKKTALQIKKGGRNGRESKDKKKVERDMIYIRGEMRLQLFCSSK